MRKVISLTATVASLLAAVSIVNAEDEGGLPISVSTTFAFESEYVFRGVGFADTSFQPSVEVGLGGAYIGVWTNQPIVDEVGFGNEVDIYAGYSTDITDMISVDGGLTIYWFPETPMANTIDVTQEVYLGFGFSVPLEPGVYFYYDFELEAFTIEVSASHSFDLAEVAEGLSFDIGAAAGYVTPDSGPDAYYASFTADLAYAINEVFSAAIGVRVSTFDDDASGTASADEDNAWWGASVSAAF